MSDRQVTMTLGEVYEVYQALDRLGKREGIKAAPSWWFATLLRKLKPEADSFLDKRQFVLEKYGSFSAPDANGMAAWTITPGKEKEFSEEYTPLVNEEITVDVNKHSLSWISPDIAASIEPELLRRVRLFIEPSTPNVSTQDTIVDNIDVKLRELDEAIASLAAMATYRMREDLAWWIIELTEEIGKKAKDMALIRQAFITKGDHKQANEVAKQSITISVVKRPISDFEELVEKWPPSMLSAIMFALTEPVERKN